MWTTKITPRFGDMDALGHVNNTVLAVWFEQARNPLFELFSPDMRFNLEDFPLIMAHTDYDFVAEILFPQGLEVLSGVSRIGNKSFTIYHEAWQEGRLCVKGHAVIVHYDFRQKASTPLPDTMKHFLGTHAVREEEGFPPPPGSPEWVNPPD